MKIKNKGKMKIVEQVATALFPIKKPEDALELRIICMLARVSEADALTALNYLIKDGYKIKLTDGLPHKFYFGD